MIIHTITTYEFDKKEMMSTLLVFNKADRMSSFKLKSVAILE